jgi:hypothetical protein
MAEKPAAKKEEKEEGSLQGMQCLWSLRSLCAEVDEGVSFSRSKSKGKNATTVDKAHPFWDHQPMPKLSTRCAKLHLLTGRRR